MSERMAKMAEEPEVPTVDGVKSPVVKSGAAGYEDRFSKNAEELKAFEGTSPNFKRRVSNQIRKLYRGTDGAESKQIQENQFISGYDAFDVVEPNDNLEHLARLYLVSPVHYGAVNAKVANIVGLGYTLVETTKSRRNFERLADDEKKTATARRNLDLHRDSIAEALENMNEEDTFTEFLVKVWRDYETTGNGYIEIGRKKDGSVGYMGHIPSQTIRIRR